MNLSAYYCSDFKTELRRHLILGLMILWGSEFCPWLVSRPNKLHQTTPVWGCGSNRDTPWYLREIWINGTRRCHLLIQISRGSALEVQDGKVGFNHTSVKCQGTITSSQEHYLSFPQPTHCRIHTNFKYPPVVVFCCFVFCFCFLKRVSWHKPLMNWISHS